ncbi:RnfH family protein [Lysobacter xanthus]
MRIEVVCAWPRRHASTWLDLPQGATVADALRAAGLEGSAVAVFGERAEPGRTLAEGDRVEVLRPLIADPKDARRRRASKRAD